MSNNLILIDGGMGQELIHRSKVKPDGLWSARVMLDNYNLVVDLHRDFIKAGAEAITLNSYSVTPQKLKRYNLEELFIPLQKSAIKAAIEAKKSSSVETDIKIIGCLPPLVMSYKATIGVDKDEAKDTYKKIVEIQEPHVDILCCETVCSIEEAHIATETALTTDKKVWLSFCVKEEDGTLLRSGERLEDALREFDNSKIDLKLQQKINYAQTISSLTLSLRAKEKIKVRQPLSKILIPVNNPEQKNIIKSVSEEIKREVNVKSIEFLEGESDLLVKSIKPNFKKLGPTYGKYMKEISTLVNSLDNHSIIELEKTAKIDLLIDKKTITFNIDDFEISSKDIEGWLVANEGNITVALDITIDDMLRDEGIAREVVSKVQNLRKSNGFEVTDRINLTFNGDDEIKNAINKNIEYVKSETLSNNIQFNVKVDGGLDLIFDKLKTKIFITKV